MTSRGLVVTEQEEDVNGLPISSAACMPPVPALPAASKGNNGSGGKGGKGGTGEAGEVNPRRSPIAELLYVRWLEGLKLKWPSIL